MNPDLKYRIWNNSCKYYVQSVNGGIAIFDLLRLINYFTSNNITNIDNFVFQRYTGLKDKDGKEIYEGDLLKRPDDSLPNFFEVYWNTQAAKFNTRVIQKHSKSIAVMPVPMEHLSRLEILGNIFESPELLVKKCFNYGCAKPTTNRGNGLFCAEHGNLQVKGIIE
jgi:uncharacterized phage protein (TIGR01671 family)